MYQITAKGARAPVETAWDALAWADPSPAGAVDAKEDGRGSWRLDAFAETEEEAEACVVIIEEICAGTDRADRTGDRTGLGYAVA